MLRGQSRASRWTEHRSDIVSGMGAWNWHPCPKENIVSGFPPEPLFSEAAAWELFDVNARVGPSGVHGELALDTAGLLDEMDRFHIRDAVVSHWTAEQYDAAAGNQALACDLHPRLTPAW